MISDKILFCKQMKRLLYTISVSMSYHRKVAWDTNKSFRLIKTRTASASAEQQQHNRRVPQRLRQSCQNVRDTANLCVIWTPVCVENYWCAVVRYLTQMCVIWLFWNLFSKISTFEKKFCKILKKSYTSTKLQKIVA